MSIVEIKSDTLTVGINTFGSEITYINAAGGTEFLWSGDENVWSGRAPVLFPICGGLKNDKYCLDGTEYTLPKHGFARHSDFEIGECTKTRAEFVLKSNDKSLENYPFEHCLKTAFEVRGNALDVWYTVENKSQGDMYFSFGAHEAYSCPEGVEEYKIVFDEPQTLETCLLDGTIIGDKKEPIISNSREIALKEEYFLTDALIFKNINFKKVTLAHNTDSKKVVLTFDTPTNFLIWQKPGAKYICLEPWDGIADDIHSDGNIKNKEAIIKLEPGKSYTMKHTMEFFE